MPAALNVAWQPNTLGCISKDQRLEARI